MEQESQKDVHILPNILVTGVPGTGKTTLSSLLHAQLNESINIKLGTAGVEYYKYLHVGEIVKNNKLWKDFDTERNCTIFDSDLLVDYLEPIVPKGGCIVDFHSCDFFPERYFDMVILLRCNNTVLFKRLEARGYALPKITENIDCEIHDVVKEEVYSSYRHEIILEASNDKETDMQHIIAQIFEALKKLDFVHRLENKLTN